MVQYQPDTDTWETLGEMNIGRSFHEVIEVPREFCSRLPAYTPTTESTTTQEAATTTEGPPVDETRVAMIVGGTFSTTSENDKPIQGVELFGCPGSEERSVPLPDTPEPLYLTDGVFYKQDDGSERVLVCGGLVCPADSMSCEIVETCYEFNSTSGDWKISDSSLTTNRSDHFMGLAPNLVIGSDERVPLVLGRSRTTDIYDPTNNQWLQYKDIPDTIDVWRKSSCITQYGDKIYAITELVYELDVTEWDINPLGTSVPDFLQNPGRCGIAVIDGVPGMYEHHHIHMYACAIVQFQYAIWYLARNNDSVGLLVQSARSLLATEEISAIHFSHF